MNGHLRSVYGVGTLTDHPVPRERTPELRVTVPPKPLPRTTVPRPVTVGVLREAKATERVKEHEVVPARLKQRRKTIAFGATTNVSQTVEREKEESPHAVHISPITRPPRMAATLGRTGVGATTRLTTGSTPRNSPLITTAATVTPTGNENRNPSEGGEEEKEQLRAALQKESSRVVRLEARVVDLEKRERETRMTMTECQKHINNLVEVVSKLTCRVADLKEEVDGKKGGGGGMRDRSSEEEDARRPLRQLQLSDEDERGSERRGGGGGRRPTITPHRLLDDENKRRLLERHLSSNPVLMRQVQDVIDEDAYQRYYGAGAAAAAGGRGGGGERRATNARRAASYFDEPPRGGGRGVNAAPSSAPNQHRWKEDAGMRMGRGGTTSPIERRVIGGGGGGGNRRRADITPSRRRVTERVTMERVHHFDDTDEGSDGGGAAYGPRYDSDDQPYTQYNEEIVEDFTSVAQVDGRRYQPTRMPQHRGGAPVITEVSDSEDSLDRKRRELKERKEAREARRMK